uniref:Uncharacterized protein n=1 Tax=Aegilops tauschii subsp. strangulata TaxID=200361 RepID=A0A453JC28_AEGTS
LLVLILVIKLPGIPFLVASLICFNAHPSPMAAASALKTAAVVAICVTMLLVQTTAGLGYSTAPAGGGLACPDAQNACRPKCRPGCEALAPGMCQAVCAVSPAAGMACVDKMFSACMTFCKTTCETLSSP